MGTSRVEYANEGFQQSLRLLDTLGKSYKAVVEKLKDSAGERADQQTARALIDNLPPTTPISTTVADFWWGLEVNAARRMREKHEENPRMRRSRPGEAKNTTERKDKGIPPFHPFTKNLNHALCASKADAARWMMEVWQTSDSKVEAGILLARMRPYLVIRKGAAKLILGDAADISVSLLALLEQQDPASWTIQRISPARAVSAYLWLDPLEQSRWISRLAEARFSER